MASDALTGKIILATAGLTLFYFLIWVAIYPFMLIDEGNLIHTFFPPLEYAFYVPIAFGVFFLGGIAFYTLYHFR